MKKSTLALIFSLLCLLMSIVPVYASSDAKIYTTYYDQYGNYITLFEDGSSITLSPIVEISESTTRASTYTKTGSRTATATDADGNTAWRFSLIGTFEYTTGVSCECTAASYTQKINDSSWSSSNITTSRSNNTAYGNALFTKRTLGITVTSKYVVLDLSCDVNGNLY